MLGKSPTLKSITGQFVGSTAGSDPLQDWCDICWFICEQGQSVKPWYNILANVHNAWAERYDVLQLEGSRTCPVGVTSQTVIPFCCLMMVRGRESLADLLLDDGRNEPKGPFSDARVVVILVQNVSRRL